MENLIELYEMVSTNDAALRGNEKMAILKARLALSMFARAMRTFESAPPDELSAAEAPLALAA
jgi:hypothetical protein